LSDVRRGNPDPRAWLPSQGAVPWGLWAAGVRIAARERRRIGLLS
jgi:hypothetical protein